MAKTYDWNSNGVTLPGQGKKKAPISSMPKAKAIQKASTPKLPKFNKKNTAKNSFGTNHFKVA